jgi:hypothetical protein
LDILLATKFQHAVQHAGSNSESPGAFAVRDHHLVYVPLQAKTTRYSVLSCCVLASRGQSTEASAFRTT